MRAAKHSAWVVILLAASLLPGCGKDSVGPELREITGHWNATKIEYVSKGTQERADLVALGGAGSLALEPDRSFLLVIAPPGDPPDSLAGAWELETDLLRLLPAPGGVVAFDAVLAGDKLTLTGADAAYDFDGDGTADPAKQNLELARQ